MLHPLLNRQLCKLICFLLVVSETCYIRLDIGLMLYEHDVRLSVTLVDCEHTVQQKVEMGTWQDRIGWCSLPACGS